jgi:hypothetical protein
MITDELHGGTRFNRTGARVCAAILLACSQLQAHGTFDHLVPVDTRLESGRGADYRKLYEDKLFSTSGGLARYVHLPGSLNEGESAASLDRRPADAAGRYIYVLTAARSSTPLWNCIATGEEQLNGKPVVDPGTVTVTRMEAPISVSAAEVIHELWVEMLKRSRPERCDECIREGTIELFSARDPAGNLMRAQSPMNGGKTTSAFVQIADSLIDYCSAPEAQRLAAAADIQKRASDLLQRLAGKRRTK